MRRKLENLGDWQVAITITLLLRVIDSAMAAAGAVFLHPDVQTIRSNALTENLPAAQGWHYALVGVWQRFDMLWYLRIAEHGYDKPMAVIFYPLYPAIIRVLDHAMPGPVAALLVSTIASFLLFYGLLRLRQETPADRWHLLLLVAAWPASFILFAGYADSLAAALIVWAVIFARERAWPLAAFCGLLAGLARPSGALVSLPLFLMAWRWRPKSWPVLFTPCGTLAYWAWLHWSGKLWIADAYRLYQGTPLAAPWTSLALCLRMIAGGDALLSIKLGLIVLALWFALGGSERTDDKLFALAAVLQMFMYTGHPIIGAPRYVLIMYPSFLGGACLLRQWSRRMRTVVLFAFGVLHLAWMVAFLKWSLEL